MPNQHFSAESGCMNSLNDCLYKYSYKGRLYIEKKQYLSRLLYELHVIP